MGALVSGERGGGVGVGPGHCFRARGSHWVGCFGGGGTVEIVFHRWKRRLLAPCEFFQCCVGNVQDVGSLESAFICANVRLS